MSPMMRLPGLASTQIVPFVTDAVLRTERVATYEAGDFLAPGVGVPKQEYRIPIAPGGGLVRVSARRGPLGQIEWDVLEPGHMDGKLHRLTYAYGYDVDMAANDDGPWETRGLSAARAEQAVNLDRAFSFHRPLVTTDANFGTVINSPDWVANGNSDETIETATSTIEDATGVPRTQLSVVLFGDAARHALRDPIFLERRQFTAGAKAATLPDLAAYWNVKEVVAYYEVYKATESSAATPLYPAHAVVLHKPASDPRTGNMRWASTYYHNDYGLLGQALEDIEVKEATGILTPWQNYVQVIVHSVDSAVLIKTP